ncbi:MAG: cobalamin-dependent protein [Desulfatibacillum sp.]|nr:cobalamin-dependent protein [Desulfatibacillum sp.]
MKNDSSASHRLSGIRVFPINALPSLQLVSANVGELCHSYEAKWEAVSRYYEEIPADLMFFFGDIVIQAEAMGAKVLFDPENMPAVKAPTSSILTPQAVDAPRMAVNARVVRDMRRAFPHRSIAGQVYGPFTAAGQVAGEQAVLRNVREGQGELASLLEKATQVAKSYARLLLDAGADVLWISDPLAALLPPDAFEACAGQYLQQVFDLVNGGPSILHICGDVSGLIKPMIDTGTAGISFDQCMELMAVEDRLPEDVAIIGNLDPVDVVAMASPESVAESTRELAATMGILPNFILSTGCALPPGTPLANIAAFMEAGNQTLDQVGKHADQLRPIASAVSLGKNVETADLVKSALSRNMDPLLITQGGLIRSVRKASARYETKQCYLPEILLTVDAFYHGMEELRPLINKAGESSVQVIIGTIKGDLHSIGKDLVRIMLEANGFGVLDLGVDVSASRFAEAVHKHNPSIVGLSAFITSARRQLPAMIEDVRRAGDSGLKVIVGGAAVNGSIATEVGADGHSPEAVAAARLVRSFIKGNY